MFKICVHQLKKAFKSPRLYISICFGCVMQVVSVLPLLEYSDTIQKPLCVWESFVYYSCDTYIVATSFLGLIVMISDIPFTRGNEIYTLIRTSRRKWIAGKMLYLLCSCVIYYGSVMLFGMVYTSRSTYLGNIWSEALWNLTKQGGKGIGTLYFPYGHIMFLKPFEAACSAFILQVGYGFLMSLILFFLNIKLPHTLGYFGTISIHAIGYFLILLTLSVKTVKYSLFGNSLLMNHSICSVYEGRYFTLIDSVMIFVAGSIFMVCFIRKAVSRYDFNITVGGIQ